MRWSAEPRATPLQRLAPRLSNLRKRIYIHAVDYNDIGRLKIENVLWLSGSVGARLNSRGRMWDFWSALIRSVRYRRRQDELPPRFAMVFLCLTPLISQSLAAIASSMLAPIITLAVAPEFLF